MSRDIEAGRAFVKLLIEDKAFNAQLNKAMRGVTKFGSHVTRMGTNLAAVGALITAPFAASLKVFSDLGDQLNDMSARTGLSVESLSVLKYAAEQSGSSLEGVEKATKGMARMLLDAERGLATATQNLTDLNLSLEDLRGLSPDRQFMLLATRLSQVDDPGRRAALAMKVFGKAGTELLPLLADGAGGIAALIDKAHALGLVMDTEAAKAAAALDDALNQLKHSVTALAAGIGQALAPAATRMIEVMTQGMAPFITWAKQNSELVMIVAAAGVGLTALGTTVAAVGLAITGLSAVVVAINTPFGLATAAVLALGGAFVGVTAYTGDLQRAIKALSSELNGAIRMYTAYLRLTGALGAINRGVIPPGVLSPPAGADAGGGGARRIYYSEGTAGQGTVAGAFGMPLMSPATLSAMARPALLEQQNRFEALTGRGKRGFASPDQVTDQITRDFGQRGTFSGRYAPQIFGSGGDNVPKKLDKQTQLLEQIKGRLENMDRRGAARGIGPAYRFGEA